MANVTSQLDPVRPVPKRLTDYTEQERDSFPKLFEFGKTTLESVSTLVFNVKLNCAPILFFLISIMVVLVIVLLYHNGIECCSCLFIIVVVS